MATTSYGTPMGSSIVPNPIGMRTLPMTTTGLQSGTTRNMSLPLALALPIQVTETTPNLEAIQNFPVAGRGLDGTHFHQDPVTGQMYVMSDELHQRIPGIIASRNRVTTQLKNNETEQDIYSTIPLLTYDTNSIYGRRLKRGDTLNTSVISRDSGVNDTINTSVSNLFDSVLLSSNDKSVRSSIGFKYKQKDTPVTFGPTTSVSRTPMGNLGTTTGLLSLGGQLNSVNGDLSPNNPLSTDTVVKITDLRRSDLVGISPQPKSGVRTISAIINSVVGSNSVLGANPLITKFIPINNIKNVYAFESVSPGGLYFVPINRIINSNNF